jgi:Ca2+:H+ antiporter
MGLVNDVEHKSLFRRDTDSPERKAASLMEQGSLSASFRECSTKTPNNSVLQSFKIVILSNKLNLLLPFGPLAILLHYLTDNKVSSCTFWVLFIAVSFLPVISQEMILLVAQGWIFLLSLVGITPLAERLGYATE